MTFMSSSIQIFLLLAGLIGTKTGVVDELFRLEYSKCQVRMTQLPDHTNTSTPIADRLFWARIATAKCCVALPSKCEQWIPNTINARRDNQFRSNGDKGHALVESMTTVDGMMGTVLWQEWTILYL